MFRTNGNPNPPAANRRLPKRARGRRKDDATFIAIAALLAIFFITQVGWAVGQQQSHSRIGISRT